MMKCYDWDTVAAKLGYKNQMNVSMTCTGRRIKRYGR